MFALEAQFYAVHRQHAVDRKMPAHVAQKLDVIQPASQSALSARLRRRRCPETQKLFEDPRSLVGVDLLDRQQLAALVLAGRVADPRRAAADQRQSAWPVCCSQASSMIGNKEPICSDGAVQSKPI